MCQQDANIDLTVTVLGGALPIYTKFTPNISDLSCLLSGSKYFDNKLPIYSMWLVCVCKHHVNTPDLMICSEQSKILHIDEQYTTPHNTVVGHKPGSLSENSTPSHTRALAAAESPSELSDYTEFLCLSFPRLTVCCLELRCHPTPLPHRLIAHTLIHTLENLKCWSLYKQNKLDISYSHNHCKTPKTKMKKLYFFWSS